MRIVALSFLLVLLSCSTQAADTSLTVTVGGETRNFTREALLARSDAATIEVPFDILSGGHHLSGEDDLSGRSGGSPACWDEGSAR